MSQTLRQRDLVERLRSLLIAAALSYSNRARRKRARVFCHELAPTANDRILDLGSEDGSHIASILPHRKNVVIADIDSEALELGRRNHGFETVLLDESGRLPFADGEFDIVFCSSVIEHVTVGKERLRDYRTQREFGAAAFEHQRRFAAEIERVGRRFFVQTPNKWFPIESHTWLPLPIVLLPRRLQLPFVAWVNRWWIKGTQLDWNLLTRKQMAELFPSARILVERSLGLPKSLIAIKKQGPGAAGSSAEGRGRRFARGEASPPGRRTVGASQTEAP
jgi:Methyltransferase domain